MRTLVIAVVLSAFALAADKFESKDTKTDSPENLDAPKQRFECVGSFTAAECRQEMLILRKALDEHRASLLGEWKWVLVRSEEWKLLLLARGINPGTPALTVLAARTTLFEDALVGGASGRVSELMEIWQLGRGPLLDLAVRHELAHAICDDPSEQEAVRVAKGLEEKRPFTCRASISPQNKVTSRSWYR
jgi:hypothetical protein